MNEFEFACPTCGQTIIAQSSDSGSQSTCPRCQTPLTVPQPPAPAPPAEAPAPVAQRTSGLAIASLVCGLVVCLGCLPGILCGHLARRRIRRDPTLKGLGLANAGLVISYLSLLINGGILASCSYQAVTGTKAVWHEAQQQMAAQLHTNAMVQLNTNVEAPLATPAPAADDMTPPMADEQATTNDTAAAAAATPPAASAGSGTGWTLDLLDVAYPDHPVSGNFRGARFVGNKVRFHSGTLSIASSEGMTYNIFLGLKKGEPLAETSYAVLPSDTAPKCRVELSWKEDGNPTTQRVLKGYALKLQFGTPTRNRLPARIYLCLPDAQKSYLAGNFTLSGRNEVRAANSPSP